MRRILINSPNEFNNQNNQSISLRYAIKKLGIFFDGVKQEDSKSQIIVSNNIFNTDARKSYTN